MSSTNIFDNYPKPASVGTVVPGNAPSRPNEYSFYRDWYIQQIYDPDLHDVEDIWSKYVVPYEGELVKDTKNKKLYIVSNVDVSTYKATLVPFSYENTEGENDDYPLFPKHEYGMLQGELPLLLDYSVSPPVATVTNVAYVANASYALLYEGSTILDGQKPISATYANQDYVTDKITVKTVMPAGWNVENDVLKCTDVFSVILPKETLKNGTRCTLVYYDENKNPIAPTYSLMVQHSEYLRDHRLSRKFIKNIELLSPWFTNTTDPNTLYIPVNIPLISVEFRAQVHYSDGTTDVQAVNGYDGISGFTLHGINRFKPTSPNQKGSLVLTYFFKEGEEAYLTQPGEPNHISEIYTIVGVASDGAYSPRIYTYPYWDTKSGWKLKHYLSDLTRQFVTDVTSYVRLNQRSPAFSGNAYGVEQTLTFNLTLSDVNPIYENWTFTQDCNVTLYNEGTSTLRKWGVRGSTKEAEFENLEVLYVPNTSGGQKAKFNGTFSTTADFLKRAYTAINPPIDPMREEKAYTPTHMTIYRLNGSYVTVTVDTYNNLGLTDWTVVNAEPFFIAWVYRDATGKELQLGVSGAITRKVSSL